MIRRPSLFWLLHALWIAVLGGYILAGTPDVPFHGDESTTIWMSRDYAYLFIQRDLELVRYHEVPANETEQHLRLVAAPLTKYLFGFAWQLNGYSIADLNEQWDWGGDYAYNVSTGHAPTRDLLMVARWTSALFLAAGVILIFALGYHAGGAPAAYLASLYYALNPALLLNGRRAMQEGALIFFGLLVVVAGLLLLQRRSWWTAVLLGTASGLAVASKHPNVFIVGAVFVACGLVAVLESLKEDEQAESSPDVDSATDFDPYTLLVLLVVAGMLALVIFYALNPISWDDPFTRIDDILDARTGILRTQVTLFGGYDHWIDQMAGFLRQVFIVRPQYYEVPAWQDYIGDQIAAYETSYWHGVSIGGSAAGGVPVAGFLLHGAWSLLVESRAVKAKTAILIGLWAAVALLTTAVLTPLEWQRYYLIAYPPLGVVAAVGLWRAARWSGGLAYRHMRRYRSTSSASDSLR